MSSYSQSISGSITIDSHTCSAFEKLLSPIVGSNFSLTQTDATETECKYEFGGDVYEYDGTLIAWLDDIVERISDFALTNCEIEEHNYCSGKFENMIRYTISPKEQGPRNPTASPPKRMLNAKMAAARLAMFFEVES